MKMLTVRPPPPSPYQGHPPPVKSQPKPMKPSGSNLLSFADDEEAPETLARSKPSSSLPVFSSHKTALLKDRSAPPPMPPSNVLLQAGTYTKKKKKALLELHKNTQTVDSSSRSDPESRPVILLKVLVRPQTAVEEKSETSQKERESEIDYNSDEKILDPAMIVGEAPLIIPLESGKSTGHGAAAFGELSDEEAEFRGRIPMLGERSDGMKKGVFRSFHERATEVVSRTENMLEEEEEGEEEQVRKGLLKRIDDSNSQGANSSSGNIGGAMSSASRGLDGLSISQPAELALKAMHENMKRFRGAFRNSLGSLDVVTFEIGSSSGRTGDLRKKYVVSDKE